MTAIAGLVDAGRVYIGGDTAGTDEEWGQMPRSDPKVFKKGEFVFGFTTSFRMGQLLRYRLDPPIPWHWEQDYLGFMSTRFIDAVRETLKEHGWASKDKERESGGTFLVGFRGGLYQIESDYQVGVNARGYDAVGSGAPIALGAFYATEGAGLDPKVRVERALYAASTFNAGVRPPFITVEST